MNFESVKKEDKKGFKIYVAVKFFTGGNKKHAKNTK